MQTSINFQEKREKFKKSLVELEIVLRAVFNVRPDLLELKKSNELVRFVWANMGDYKCESLLRIARKIRAEGLDTEENQLERANAECAYRGYLNSSNL